MPSVLAEEPLPATQPLTLIDELDGAGRFAARNVAAHGYRFDGADPADAPPAWLADDT